MWAWWGPCDWSRASAETSFWYDLGVVNYNRSEQSRSRDRRTGEVVSEVRGFLVSEPVSEVLTLSVSESMSEHPLSELVSKLLSELLSVWKSIQLTSIDWLDAHSLIVAWLHRLAIISRDRLLLSLPSSAWQKPVKTGFCSYFWRIVIYIKLY